MLSLVNYDSSDDEEVESSEPRESIKVSPKDVITPESDSSNKTAKTGLETSNILLKGQTGLGLDKTSVTKTSSGRVQIKLAPLDLIHQQDSDSDEDERERKRLKRSEKGSGLISLLPKPKLTQPKKTSLTSLIPSSVSNRGKTQNNHKSVTETVNNSTFRSKELYKNSEDEYDYTNTIWSGSTSGSDTTPVYGPSKPLILDTEAYSSVEPLDPNEDTTYKKFIASKFDDDSSNIKIVDVDLSKHLSENKEWLKNISVEKEKLADEDIKSEAPNSTARRKNQITFLAYQAKKREIELKNQWAANRVTKNQTRAKYGF